MALPPARLHPTSPTSSLLLSRTALDLDRVVLCYALIVALSGSFQTLTSTFIRYSMCEWFCHYVCGCLLQQLWKLDTHSRDALESFR